MIRFIWNNWQRKKGRFLLLLVGALIISGGLSYIVGLSEMNKETVEHELQERWVTSYDIVVRPEGTRSETEGEHLLEPNYLSGIPGGISLDQYEKIKQINDVAVAAPIAMIGYANYNSNLAQLELEEEGIYSLVKETTIHDGAKERTSSIQSYFPAGDWNILEENIIQLDQDHPIGFPHENIVFVRALLFAGIDPEQEAKLVGLDEATIESQHSRYFSSEDIATEDVWTGNIMQVDFPVMMNYEAFVDETVHYTIEKLDGINFSRETANETLNMIADNGGYDYLDALERTEVQTVTVKDEEGYKNMLNVIAGINLETGESHLDDYTPTNADYTEGDQRPTITTRPGPLSYQKIESPDADKWPYVYGLELTEEDMPIYDESIERYRKMVPFQDEVDKFLQPHFIGVFDPSQLDVSKDPLTEVPMETYQPPTAELVMGPDQQVLDSPVTLQPVSDPYGFLTHPPNLLTTIEAAEKIMGEESISAIRVKVAGVTAMSEASQRIVEKVAKQIEKETGLITDITIGSSPQKSLTYAQGINEEEDIGWVQQPWVYIGAFISMFRESNIGLAGLVASVMMVAIVYVFSSTHVSMLARKQDFATLLAVGWRPSQLSRLLFTESVLIGAFVALISWSVLGFIYMFGTTPISPNIIVLTGLFGFGIYVLGAIIPTLFVRQTNPYGAMHTGEIATRGKRVIRTRGIISMAWNHFFAKWTRNILSIIAIALPTSLLALFLFITIRFQGVMEATLFGQFIMVEIGALHYTIVIVSLLIAVLTTAEIMWQNIVERSQEIAVLKAIGWQDGRIGILVIIEGIWTGVLAAILGLLSGIAIIWGMYKHIPMEHLIIILMTGFVPVIIAVIGAIFPARKATHTPPAAGMRGNYSVQKKAK